MWGNLPDPMFRGPQTPGLQGRGGDVMTSHNAMISLLGSPRVGGGHFLFVFSERGILRKVEGASKPS